MPTTHIVTTKDPVPVIQELIQTYGRDGIHLVVPSAYQKQALLRQFSVSQSDVEGGTLFPVETWRQWVLRQANQNVSFSEEEKLMLYHHVLSDVKPFGDFWTKLGTAQDFIHLADFLMDANCSVAEYLDAYRALAASDSFLNDLNRMLNKYMALVQKMNLTSFSMVCRKLSEEVALKAGRESSKEIVENSSEANNSSKTILVMVGFLSLKPYEACLLPYASLQTLYLIQDKSSEMGHLAYKHIKHPAIQIEPIDLFGEVAQKTHHVLTYQTPYLEVGHIVQDIARRINQKQCALDDIAIVLGSSPTYRQLFDYWFSVFDLKQYVGSAKQADISTPVMDFFVALLDVFCSDFSLETVGRFLSLSLASSCWGKVGEDDRLLHVRSELLLRLIPFLKLQTPDAMDSRSQGQQEQHYWVDVLDALTTDASIIPSQHIDLREFLDKQKASIQDVVVVTRQLFALYKSWQSLTTGKDVFPFFLKVSKTFNLLYVLANSNQNFYAEGVNAFSSTLDYIKSFCETWDQFSTQLSGDVFDVLSFTQRLQEYVSNRQNNQALAYLSKIVVKPSEAYGLQRRIMYVPGCVEGVWPPPDATSSFLTDAIKLKLQPEGQTQYQELKQIMAHLRQQSGVFFSYSKSLNGVDTVPSHFMADIKATHIASTVVPDNYALHKQEANPEKINESAQIGLHRASAPSRSGREASSLKVPLPNTYSVAQLEMYQKCPHQYFFKYVLNETNINTAFEEISAAQWGILIHDICCQTLKALKDRSLSLRQDSQHQQAKQLIHDIAKQVFYSYANGSFYWLVKHDVLFGSDGQKGLLDAFIDQETLWDVEAEPTLFEFSFGKDTPFTLQLDTETSIQLSGQIDCVLETKQDDIVLVDYKTGATLPTPADVKHGKSLQLSLYAAVLTKLFPQKRLAGGIFYQIKDADRVKKAVVISTEEAKQALFNLGRKRPHIWDESFEPFLKSHILNLKTSVESGMFSPNSHDQLPHMKSSRAGACKFCGYRSVCRYKERYAVYG